MARPYRIRLPGGTPCRCRCQLSPPSSLRRLKTINLVIRSTQGAEELVKKYEDQLKDVQTVPADLKELEASKAELKVRAGAAPRRGGAGGGRG